jgi:hypothetical protein
MAGVRPPLLGPRTFEPIHIMTSAHWGLLVLLVISVGTFLALLRYVERTYPQLWENLGRPTFEMSNLSLACARFMLFLRNGEFLAVPDWKLLALCALTLVSGWLVVLVGFYSIVHG